MIKKVLSFIYNTKLKKFLALQQNPHPEHAPNGGWFVVTGSVENKENNEDAVAREVREETGLFVGRIINLNTNSKYIWNGEECEEHNFICFVDEEKIVLNEEHVDYEWLDAKAFVNKIDWLGDKNKLRRVLDSVLIIEKD